MTVAVVAALVAVAWLAKQYPLTDFIDTNAVGDWARSMGFVGMLLFFVVGAFFTAFGLPRQLLAFIGGYTYGVATGVLLGTIAAVTGALITLSVARYLTRPYVQQRFPKHIAAIDNFAAKNLFLKILLIRFLPFGTNLATNLAAGVTDVRVPSFLLASFLGYIPQMLIFALTGHGINVGSQTQLVVAGVLFTISLIIGAYIYQQERRNSRAPDAKI